MKGIRLDEHNDLHLDIIRDADDKVIQGVVTDDSTQQNQGLLLMFQKGELKEYPLIGVGIENYLNDDDGGVALMREIKRQFAADGMTVEDVKMVDGELYINADYDN